MQIRIIAGILGGRRLKTPIKFKAKPMGERVRSAIFNSLAGIIEGSSFLDAFGGSGACGLEALSRGANQVTIVEKDRGVFQMLTKNVEDLNLASNARLSLINGPIFSVLQNMEGQLFELILCDPPYDLVEGAGVSALQESLNLVARHLEKNGTLILSWPERVELPTLSGLKLKNQKKYAGAKIGWYESIAT